MKIEANDIRELQLFKYYRIVRKWACKNNSLKEADLELLIYFDCIGIFSRNDYIQGVYTYSWDKHRWERLVKQGWISVYQKRNRTTNKYNLYKISYKCKHLITRIYKILLGEEDISETKSFFVKNKSYTDKVFGFAIDNMIKDKTR
tara:strand:+ start:1242 stop:1679 length:438 start_codon:yes stop_codon:yes gene_type:complete